MLLAASFQSLTAHFSFLTHVFWDGFSKLMRPAETVTYSLLIQRQLAHIRPNLTIICSAHMFAQCAAAECYTLPRFHFRVNFVNRYRRYIPIVAAILVLFGVNLDKLGIDLQALSGGKSTSLTSPSSGGSHPSTEKWSSTNPEINLWHIFDGEINRKGKPTGYHSRPGGNDPANARVKSIRDQPNKAGVYTAVVEVRDGSQWKSKNSSFFPDSLSRDEVIDIIVHAFKNSDNPKKQPWSGPSGQGYTVQGYTTNQGGINTAYPLYNRNQ